MTLILGANFGRYVLITADTRVTWYPPHLPVFYTDHPKIQATKFGIIAGAGYVPLIDRVKARFAAGEIEHTDDVIRVIKEERTRVLTTDLHLNDDPRCDDALATTGWFFTYVNHSQQFGPTNALRLVMYHPSVNEERLSSFEICQPIVHLPAECKGTLDPKEISEMLRPLLKPFQDGGDVASSVSENIAVFGGVMHALSTQLKSVSPTFTIGLHVHPYEIAISETLTVDQPFSLKTTSLFVPTDSG